MRKMVDDSFKDATLSPDVGNVGQFKPHQDQGRLSEERAGSSLGKRIKLRERRSLVVRRVSVSKSSPCGGTKQLSCLFLSVTSFFNFPQRLLHYLEDPAEHRIFLPLKPHLP